MSSTTTTTTSSRPSRSASPTSSISSLSSTPPIAAEAEDAHAVAAQNEANRARMAERSVNPARERDERTARFKSIAESMYAYSTNACPDTVLTPRSRSPATARLLHLIQIKTHLLQCHLAIASSQPRDATAHATAASSLCDDPSLQAHLPPTLKARCTYWLGVAAHHEGDYLNALECYKAAEPALASILPGTPFSPQYHRAQGGFEAERIGKMKARAMREVLRTPVRTGELRVCRDVVEREMPEPVSAHWRAVRHENLEEELRDCVGFHSPEMAVAEEEEPKMSSAADTTTPARRELHMRSSSSASISSTGSLAERRHRSRPSEILVLDKLSL